MKKNNLLLIALFCLAACSNKPGQEDLRKSADSAFDGFKAIGLDLGQYITNDSFEVIDSYEEGNFYIIKAIPKIKITKSLDEKTIQQIKDQLGMNYAPAMQVINFFELSKKYRNGEMNYQQLIIEMSIPPYPKGTLKAGDSFSGPEEVEYKFRKTDNGWMAVE